MKKVAITGSYAVGKSTVCGFFKELGAYVVSADAIVHRLLSSSTDISLRVRGLLGEEVIVNGEIDRSRVAQKVFADAKLLQQLEAILHPAVLEELQKEVQKAILNNVPLFVAEVPLLFEADFEKEFDVTVAVLCDIPRRPYSPDEEARRSRMLTPQQKAHRAQYVLVNNETLASLKKSVITLFNQLVSS
ncbi:MAG: dephospho-CoA kinase [Verrucomicrobia bacterium]|nr:dephospho-CoA kinase [Verrucomicrobiota bacterium]MBS0645678.1 dephospho-CoA kinase [Verrucomicrobiota bacterium]